MVETTTHAPTVTRVEIIDAVESAFTGSWATKQDIVTAAMQSQARDELIETLHRLPERSFGHVRDIWDHLSDVPLEH